MFAIRVLHTNLYKRFFLSFLFLFGSALGQFLLKQISINIKSGKIIAYQNFLLGASLILILALCQGFYILSMQRFSVSTIYPLTIGSAYLGVMLMSALVLNEPLQSKTIIGATMIMAGIILARS